jgi:hypothetical protein
VPIKDFVQQFKGDIANELDKRLFKKLCDRWCVPALQGLRVRWRCVQCRCPGVLLRPPSLCRIQGW